MGEARPGTASLVGTTVGRYRILEHIGEGGMGVVYRAMQEPLGRVVALKLIHRNLASDSMVVTRFLREARISAALTNPNTVTIYDFGRAEDGALYLAMEFVEGESLKRRLERRGALPPDEATTIAIQVCRSLVEAHRKDIVHRDLKPENVLVAPNEDGTLRVKVLDYGLARSVHASETEAAAQVTQVGVILGTPEYMSPEQAQGIPVQTRSDLYSLGVVLYEMLTGVPPFDSESQVSIMAAHVVHAPPPMSEVGAKRSPPRELEQVVMKMLEKDPAARPRDALEVMTVLKRYLFSARPEALSQVFLDPGGGDEEDEAATTRTSALPDDVDGEPPRHSSSVPPLEGERTLVSETAFPDEPDDPPLAVTAPRARVPVPTPLATPVATGPGLVLEDVVTQVDGPPESEELAMHGRPTEPPQRAATPERRTAIIRRDLLSSVPPRLVLVIVVALIAGITLALLVDRRSRNEAVLPEGYVETDAPASWSGRYETNRGALVLDQRADSIAGTLGAGASAIRVGGTLNGAVLEFAWAAEDTGAPVEIERSGRGELRWVQAPDGRKLVRATLGYGTAAVGAGAFWATPE